MNKLQTSTRHQQGISLIEALIALLVLSLGMLTVSQLQGHLRLGSDIARQRTEAVRLGQEDIEALRGYSVIAASGAEPSWAGITSASRSADASTGYATHTRYTVAREIVDNNTLAAKTAAVTVHWNDRDGEAQKIVLTTVIAANDPAHGGVLAVAPSAAHAKGASSRSTRVPLLAKNLGDGRSAMKPTATSTTALVFDNASGNITARCSGINPATATLDLALADLTACGAINAQLLSGSVRFSQTAPPDAARGNDAPLALTIALTLTGGRYATAPECNSEAVQTESGDRYVAYHCVVVPLANGRWSGRSTVVPSGWALGTAADARRVCRYSADLDSSGAIDSNEEHPAAYNAVDHSLANQNFLVIAGNQTCPAGAAGDDFVNHATAAHQP
ncbi:MAG: prepilin-type N-terminal cleavage/methylation domain-containing protein [Burkholderiaceae bacterium]